MKKTIIMLSLALAIAAMTSCTNDIVETPNCEESALNDWLNTEDNILRVADREELANLIANGLPESTRAKTQKFISLMDMIPYFDPALDTLSQEERDTIFNNHLSYYEAFGYEDIIPNKNFAKLINYQGEIIVNDTIYKVTPLGTAYAHNIHKVELDSVVQKIPAQSPLFPNGEKVIKLSPHVKMINSFLDKKPISLDSMKCIYDSTFYVGSDGPSGSWIDTGSGSSGSGSGSGSSGSGDASEFTPLSNIPFSTFPTFSSSCHTFFGKAIDWLIGERHTRHHEFKSGYRVGGSLYDYNYGIYHECGAFVKMEKKRGGLLKKINGWKNINGDELVLHFDKMALKMDCDVPASFFAPFNGKPTFVGIADFNSKWKHVSISAKDWSAQQVKNFFADGVSSAITKLSAATNSTIPANTRSFQIVTQGGCYRYMYDATEYRKNQKKLQIIFDSGSNFELEFTDNTNAFSLVYGMIKGLFENQDYDIIDGGVQLAGRLGTNWGGMKINK